MIRRLFKMVVGLLASLQVFRFFRPSQSKAPEPEKRTEPPTMKQRLRTAGAVLAALTVGGFLLAASGVIPITASSGHWGITRWFLSFSMQRSISFHTIGKEAPPLDDPELVLKGAGHYETGCRPCHGSPGLHHPRIAQQMTPHPPYLAPEIDKWDPAELFYIVKHGIKFTGMPAWPARHRDDEVWAVVAFLRALPDLNAREYQVLAQGESPLYDGTAPMRQMLGPRDVPPAVAQSCARCHGIKGLGRGAGEVPRLAGQHPIYLFAALQAYARGERHSGIMEPVAAGLSLEEMRELARYYGSVDTPPPAPDSTSLLSIKRGRMIAHEGIPSQGIPSCADCHGPTSTPRNPAYPVLAGQYADYIVLQLELFKKDHRGGSVYSHLMRPTADRLTKEQMRDVALYYESLTSRLAP